MAPPWRYAAPGKVEANRTEGIVTILERVRGDRRRPVQIGRMAKDLMNRDISAFGRDAVGVLDQVRDVASDAIEAVQSMAADAADRAGEAIDQVGDGASKAATDLSRSVAKVSPGGSSDGIRGDRGVDDIVDRIKRSLPTERITNLVENLERELPTTDKGRYDRAYERGWARARSSFVVVGAVTGILAGIAGAYFLDPKRGPQRRQRIGSNVRRVTKDVSHQVGRTATMTADRARGFAHERGLLQSGRTTDPVLQATPVASLVGVMDPGVSGSDANAAQTPDPLGTDVTPVMPFADGPVTDPSSIEREPLDAPAGGIVGGTAGADLAADAAAGDVPPTDVTAGSGSPEPLGEPAGGEIDDARLPVNSSAVTSTLEPQAEDATITGDGEDRGTWHRTL
jgi:hypothetical protein